MQLTERIEAIETRLKAINLKLWRLCKDAGVDYGTVHRWRTGKTVPLLTTAEQHLGALEAALSRHETIILEKLRKRRPSPGATARA